MSRSARTTQSSPLVAGSVLWERFWAKVRKTDTCWLWTGATSVGYGMFKHTGVGATMSTHRLAYESLVGPIPAGQSVLHRCDTPACVNPSHLFLGSQADNMRDCAEKGRARGRFSGTTVCGKGLHALDGDNAKVRPDGARRCVACEKAYRQSRYLSKARTTTAPVTQVA